MLIRFEAAETSSGKLLNVYQSSAESVSRLITCLEAFTDKSKINAFESCEIRLTWLVDEKAYIIPLLFPPREQRGNVVWRLHARHLRGKSWRTLKTFSKKLHRESHLVKDFFPACLPLLHTDKQIHTCKRTVCPNEAFYRSSQREKSLSRDRRVTLILIHMRPHFH